ncbi:transposable element Tcb2 transposase [Trichonephila clavipes]|nr:transposable element Tcb2 transposase [Trichonephila clavipes]
MSQQRDLPESMAWRRVIGRLESGQTQRGVADAVGVARSVVAKAVESITRNRKFNSPSKQNRECYAAAKTVALGKTGRRVSSQTVRNRLHEGGIYARRPMVCIPLTPHPNVTPDVFLYGGTGALRNNPAFVREGHNTEELVGWYGVESAGGRTDLHIIRNGTLTGRRYADEILRPHVIPYAGAIGDSFVFQDDNARPHRARLVENMLEAETIQRMEFPACSPDLNPIEHVWDMLSDDDIAA